MTDDEILQLVDTECPSREYVRIMTNQDLIDFAEAVVHRTLTNQKARWYQEGVESEREACAKLCEESRTKYVDRTISEPRTIDPEVARVAMMTCDFIAHDIRQRGE